MTDHLNLIRIKLQHLSRMSGYLAYSLSQVCEFQEHLGKTTRALAIEEEQEVECFGAVLAVITAVTGQSVACVKMQARTPLTSGVCLASEHFLSAGNCSP